jgi:hypothetical protein
MSDWQRELTSILALYLSGPLATEHGRLMAITGLSGFAAVCLCVPLFLMAAAK